MPVEFFNETTTCWIWVVWSDINITSIFDEIEDLKSFLIVELTVIFYKLFVSDPLHKILFAVFRTLF